MRSARVLVIILGLLFCPQAWPTRPTVMRMKATAFSQEAQPTASGTAVHEGIVAADPAVLPLGSRIRISGAGPYDGTYLVTDTGAKIVGRHIDVYLASNLEAKRFGKKMVTVTVLEKGEGARDAREKDPVGTALSPAPAATR